MSTVNFSAQLQTAINKKQLSQLKAGTKIVRDNAGYNRFYRIGLKVKQGAVSRIGSNIVFEVEEFQTGSLSGYDGTVLETTYPIVGSVLTEIEVTPDGHIFGYIRDDLQALRDTQVQDTGLSVIQLETQVNRVVSGMPQKQWSVKRSDGSKAATIELS